MVLGFANYKKNVKLITQFREKTNEKNPSFSFFNFWVCPVVHVKEKLRAR